MGAAPSRGDWLCGPAACISALQRKPFQSSEPSRSPCPVGRRPAGRCFRSVSDQSPSRWRRLVVNQLAPPSCASARRGGSSGRRNSGAPREGLGEGIHCAGRRSGRVYLEYILGQPCPPARPCRGNCAPCLGGRTLEGCIFETTLVSRFQPSH